MSESAIVDQNGNSILTSTKAKGEIAININDRNIPMGSNITIGGSEIASVAGYLYSLDLVWRASGTGTDKQPINWLNTRSTQKLITILNQSLVNMALVNVRDGKGTDANLTHLVNVNDGVNKGSYGSIMVIIAYATWISPEFQLSVMANWAASYYDVKSKLKLIEGSSLPQIASGSNLTIPEFAAIYNTDTGHSLTPSEVYIQLSRMGYVDLTNNNMATKAAIEDKVLMNASLSDVNGNIVTTAYVPPEGVRPLKMMLGKSVNS